MRTRGLKVLQKRARSRGQTRRIEDGECVGCFSDDFLKGYSICAMADASPHAVYCIQACTLTFYENVRDLTSLKYIHIYGWQRDSPVRDADYEPFDSILCPNRSQKSQEISIRRSSNDVRTLRDHEDCRAEFSPTRQHLF